MNVRMRFIRHHIDMLQFVPYTDDMQTSTGENIQVRERARGTRCCCEDILPRLSMQQARQMADDLQVLAHPVRLQLLDILARNEGQVCVCDLEAAVPVKQPTVSHHLKLLREAGLVDFERHGLWAYYFVRRDALAAMRARVAALLDSLG